MRLTDTRRAWLRWYKAAGSLWCGWTICPSLLSPAIAEIAPQRVPDSVEEEAATLAAQLAATLRRYSPMRPVGSAEWPQPDTPPEIRGGIHATTGTSSSVENTPSETGGGVCVVLDLEPTLGVLIAARLNQWELANVTLVLPRWPYGEAVLPVDQLVHTLVTRASTLTTDNYPNVVFVLDAERNKNLQDRSPRDHRADNRYRLPPFELPNLADLRARGIRHVLKVSTRGNRQHPSLPADMKVKAGR